MAEIKSTYFNEIIDKLNKLVKKKSLLLLFIGIQSVLIITALTSVSFALLESLGYFTSAARTILFIAFLIINAAAFVFLFILPLLKYLGIFSKTDYFRTAEEAGEYFPSIKDDLLNALQLVSSTDAGDYYSSTLIDASFERVYRLTKNIQFTSIVKFDKARELFKYFLLTLAAAIIFFLFPSVNAAAIRLINFSTEFTPPAKFYIEVTPGNITVTKGDNVHVKVKVKGEIPRKIFLATKTVEQTSFEEHELRADSNAVYYYSIESIRNSLKYFAYAEDISSSTYELEVIDRPLIKSLELTIVYPSYSRLTKIHQSDNGSITALTGSIAAFEIVSTKKLRSAKLIFGDSSEASLTVTGWNASGNLKIRKDDSYKIVITDEEGNQNSSPITYYIKSLQDEFPAVELIRPEKDVSLDNDNRLPVYAKVSDDFGFSRFLLHYRLSASKYETPWKEFKQIELPVNKTSKEDDINYFWNLSPLNLGTEDVATFYLEVFDNDAVSGPKSSKSKFINIRVPSLDELLAQSEKTHLQAEQELKQILKEADELRKNLDKIDNELKQDKKEITWQEKEKLEKAVEKFEELQNKIEDVGKQLDRMKEELQKNNLMSKETLEKYMELQKLFQQLTSDEMKKAMEQLQSLLQKMDRQQIQEAMKNMKFDEEQFQKSLERTINLLKRVQVEQRINEMIKRTEDLGSRQENLLEQTKQSDLSEKSENEKMAEKQSEITEELNELSEKMQSLQELMSAMEDMPKDELQKLSEEFEKQDNWSESEKAAENLKQNRKQEAIKQQSQLSMNIQRMKEGFQQMQESIKQQNQMQVFLDMMKILDNILTLSKMQEELKSETQKLDPNSSLTPEKAKKQNNIRSGLDKLLQQMVELSQKTFAITPEMGRSLGKARREMDKAVEGLQNRNGGMSAMSQGEAMKSLNEAAALMKSSMESMMQGGGQGGMMSLMQQLGRLSGMQMNLNNLTQMLQQQMQGQLTMQQQAELQRLAQEQELIRKSIEQLEKEAREAGKSKSLAANLENILKQIEEVVTDMRTQNVNDELLQKQERILSKLLDAQRSINERDYEKERESFAGKNVLRQSPSELNISSDRVKEFLKDELNRAIQEGFSKDYQDLIRKYYELLQQEKAIRE